MVDDLVSAGFDELAAVLSRVGPVGLFIVGKGEIVLVGSFEELTQREGDGVGLGCGLGDGFEGGDDV